VQLNSKAYADVGIGQYALSHLSCIPVTNCLSS
jgi:hypothetical protein